MAFQATAILTKIALLSALAVRGDGRQHTNYKLARLMAGRRRLPAASRVGFGVYKGGRGRSALGAGLTELWGTCIMRSIAASVYRLRQGWHTRICWGWLRIWLFWAGKHRRSHLTVLFSFVFFFLLLGGREDHHDNTME